MVKQYLIIFIILLATSCKTINSRFYEPFSLTLELNKDTIVKGDLLKLKLVLKNTSFSPVVFYPNGFIFLKHSNLGCFQEIKILNEEVDTLNKVNVPIGGFAIKNHFVTVDSPFFKFNALNSIELFYSFDLARNKKYRKYIKQKGHINYWYNAKSNIATIYVKN